MWQFQEGQGCWMGQPQFCYENDGSWEGAQRAVPGYPLPTAQPTPNPSAMPTEQPTSRPTAPTGHPSSAPTSKKTMTPTQMPSLSPTKSDKSPASSNGAASTRPTLYIVIGILGFLLMVGGVVAAYFWYRSVKTTSSGAGGIDGAPDRASAGGGRFGGEVQSEMVANPMRSTIDTLGRAPSIQEQDKAPSDGGLPA